MRGGCLLNQNDYKGMCYSCLYYNDYGPVGGRLRDYNGKCRSDNNETDELV